MGGNKVMMYRLKKYTNDVSTICDFSRITIFSFILSAVLIVLDYYNIPTQLLCKIPLNLFLVIGAIIATCIFVSFFANKYYLIFADRSINIIDIIAFCLLFSILSYYLLAIVLQQLNSLYKTICFIVIVCSSIIIIAVRCKRHNNNKQDNPNRVIYDFKDIVENNFQRVVDSPILIDENDVDYDLLDRTILINHLHRSIITVNNNDHSYVIGLEGEWGSGKTTIINNVKRTIREDSKDFLIIDDFDPWTYGTNESMISAMYESIILNSGINKSSLNTKQLIKDLINDVCTNIDNIHISGKTINHLIGGLSKERNSVSKLKHRIGSYLKSNNKRIVFFIDNIDRIDANNIIFLLKLIGVVFDIPNITYVISYDNKRMTDILNDTLQIDPHYIDKIIQQVITISSITMDKTKNVYEVSINNILKAYGICETELSKYEPIKKYLCNSIKEIRQFKRIINSVFGVVFSEKSILNIHELLAIEVIHFLEPDVYGEIYNQKTYFISFDTFYDKTIYGEQFNPKKFNSQAIAFFDDFKKKCSLETMQLLSTIFPYVKRYMAHEDSIKPTYPREGDSLKGKGPSISSAKYFELYFSFGNNVFTHIRNSVTKFISDINIGKDTKEINDDYFAVLNHMDADFQREWYIQLNLSVDSVAKEKKLTFIEVLYENSICVDDSKAFLQLSARSYVSGIISDTLLLCTDNEIQKTIALFINDYVKLTVIGEILYFVSKSFETKSDVIKSAISPIYEKMIKQIADKRINIYDDQYYCVSNAYRLLDENYGVSNEEFKDYIKAIIDKSNIYKILRDIVSISISSDYSYYIKDENVHLFFEDTAIIDSILSERKPQNDSEEFLKAIYDNYINTKNGAKVDEIKTSTYYKFDL